MSSLDDRTRTVLAVAAVALLGVLAWLAAGSPRLPGVSSKAEVPAATQRVLRATTKNFLMAGAFGDPSTCQFMTTQAQSALKTRVAQRARRSVGSCAQAVQLAAELSRRQLGRSAQAVLAAQARLLTRAAASASFQLQGDVAIVSLDVRDGRRCLRQRLPLRHSASGWLVDVGQAGISVKPC